MIVVEVDFFTANIVSQYLQVNNMRSSILIPALFVAAFAQTQYTSTGTAAVAKARATAKTESPTSNVVGNSFSRFVTIWCENTDYSMAAGDREKIHPCPNMKS